MSSATETAAGARGPWKSILRWSVLYLTVVAILSSLVRETVPGICDENVGPGTPDYEGCQFLENGGYTAIRIVPGAVLIAFALFAGRLRRVGVLHLGFAVALVLLALAAGLNPKDYPV